MGRGFRRDGEVILLLNSKDDTSKAVLKLTSLNKEQLDTIRKLERTWGVTLLAYSRKE